MADKEEKESKSGGGLLPIINLVLLVLVLAVGGFVAWKLMNMEQPAETPEKPAIEQTDETVIPEAEDETGTPPIPVEVENLTINLADTDRDRYLRVKITLEVRNEESKAKINDNMVKIKDLLISSISGKKFSDIRTPQGKYELKMDLIYRINRLVGGKPVRNLYFSDFVSQ